MQINTIQHSMNQCRTHHSLVYPHDSVSFSSRLISKYKINLKDLPVDGDIDISQEQKKILVEKILEGHEHAKKNVLNGNIVKVAYATNIGLSNGVWALGTNFNNTRNNISAICGERSAILNAFNKFLKNPKSDFKVDYIAMSSYKYPESDPFTLCPCAECLSWFNTTRFFQDDTVVAGLIKDENDNLKLVLRTLKQYLPFRGEPTSLQTDDDNNLIIQKTDKAIAAMSEKNITDAEVKELFLSAQKDYNSHKNAGASAGILDINDEITTGRKQSWTARWFTEPAEFAIAKILEQNPDTKIKAIAYYGNSSYTDKYGQTFDDGLVSIKTLGFTLAKFNDPQILVITMTDDKLNVRTIDDYMPSNFRYVGVDRRTGGNS